MEKILLTLCLALTFSHATGVEWDEEKLKQDFVLLRDARLIDDSLYARFEKGEYFKGEMLDYCTCLLDSDEDFCNCYGDQSFLRSKHNLKQWKSDLNEEEMWTLNFCGQPDSIIYLGAWGGVGYYHTIVPDSSELGKKIKDFKRRLKKLNEKKKYSPCSKP